MGPVGRDRSLREGQGRSLGARSCAEGFGEGGGRRALGDGLHPDGARRVGAVKELGS